MKKSYLILILLLSFNTAFSQKVPVSVVSHEQSGFTRWQILDENYGVAFAGSQLFSSDTISFTLEPEKRYFFYFSLNEEEKSDRKLYTLFLGVEPLLIVSSTQGNGDHFIPFFTGVRKPEPKITGGEDAVISEFPWNVYITTVDMSCGGSIIAPGWILTAAHCVYDDNDNVISAADLVVKAGMNNPYDLNDGATYTVAEVLPHENYDGVTLENDIALLRLNSPVNTPDARPVKLITADDEEYGATDPGVMTWITGWGLVSRNPNVYPRSLQKLQLPIITRQQASTVWPRIPSTVLMAGYLNGNRDACSGDSGGPMVVEVLGEYKLAGIVSWGSRFCDTYGAYTRVALFGEWISQKTGIPPLYSPPDPTGDTVICRGESTATYSVQQVPGITSHEWRLVPSAAGTVSGPATSATVSWNSDFTGIASLAFRVTRGGALSEWSRLDIRVVPPTAITSQLQDVTNCQGVPVVLDVEAEGYNLRYEWFREGIMIHSSVQPGLLFSAPSPGNSGTYRVRVSGECGSVTSGDFVFTVHPVTAVRDISPDRNAALGSDVTIEVDAQGHDLEWQWSREETPIQGATTAGLVLRDVDATDIGLYSVSVSGTCGTATSRDVYLFVHGASASGGNNILLWPSVTDDRFSIAVAGDDQYNVNIYNSRGGLVRSYRDLQYENEFNISMLPEGMYLVTIFNREFRKTIKVVKNL